MLNRQNLTLGFPTKMRCSSKTFVVAESDRQDVSLSAYITKRMQPKHECQNI